MTANEYVVTVKRPNGQEVLLRQFAYNPMDAWQQAIITCVTTWPGEEVKVTAVGPPPESYAKSDVANLLDRLGNGLKKYGAGKPDGEKK